MKNQAKNQLSQALGIKNEIEEYERKRPLSPKKKEDRNAIKEMTDKMIKKELIKMDEALSKDGYKQNIEELTTLLKKKEYGRLAQKARDFDLGERKIALYNELTQIEIKFINVAKLYLQIFDWSPQKKYITAAKKVYE